LALIESWPSLLIEIWPRAGRCVLS